MRERYEVKDWIDDSLRFFHSDDAFNCLSEYLGVTIRTIRRWRAQNRAPAAQLARMMQLVAGLPLQVNDPAWSGWQWVAVPVQDCVSISRKTGRRKYRTRVRYGLASWACCEPWFPEQLEQYRFWLDYGATMAKKVDELRAELQRLQSEPTQYPLDLF